MPNQLFINGKEVINDTFLPNKDYSKEEIKDIVFENACNMWLGNYQRVETAVFGNEKFFSDSFKAGALLDWFHNKIKQGKVEDRKKRIEEIDLQIAHLTQEQEKLNSEIQ